MKTSTIRHRACLVAAGALVLVLGSATPSMAAGAGPSPSTLRHDPDQRQQPNPLGFRGLGSPDQDAEEGTLGQGPREVDAEVGAGEHAAVDIASSTPRHGAGADWVVQGIVILSFLAIVSMSISVIFKPSDQIPRIGGSHSDA